MVRETSSTFYKEREYERPAIPRYQPDRPIWQPLANQDISLQIFPEIVGLIGPTEQVRPPVSPLPGLKSQRRQSILKVDITGWLPTRSADWHVARSRSRGLLLMTVAEGRVAPTTGIRKECGRTG
jgi:hypothetical protein